MGHEPHLAAYHFHERDWDSYQELYDEFEWEVPEEFNIATYVCDRWAEETDRVAVYAEKTTGEATTVTFEELYRDANALANALEMDGISRGDRVAVNAPQKPETLVAHLAIWKLGAVSVPLSILFGDDAITYRVNDAAVSACIVDEANIDTFRTVADTVNLDAIFTIDVDQPRANETDIRTAIESASDTFETVRTAPDDTALIIYTSGTTGEPKGVVHAHQMLLGQLPHFLCSLCNLALSEDDSFYAPVEWAWIAIFNFVFPALFYRRPVVAYAGGPFDPETTFQLIENYSVTSFGAPPTALRRLKQANIAADFELSTVRVVESGGESLGQAVADWTRDAFGATLHEQYGQTEADVVIGDCSRLLPRKDGKMGVELPGHEVAVLDTDTHEPVDPGEVGELAVRYGEDPVCLQEYWKKPEQTAQKIHDGWVLTEDLGTVDEDGYFAFAGRKDDVILRSGYRVSPEELEAKLAEHEAVADAGVIGIPDEKRGEVPKAFIVISDENEVDHDALPSELQSFAKHRLATYEYPSEIDFIDELPKTVTGKIRRTALRERESGARD